MNLDIHLDRMTDKAFSLHRHCIAFIALIITSSINFVIIYHSQFLTDNHRLSLGYKLSFARISVVYFELSIIDILI